MVYRAKAGIQELILHRRDWIPGLISLPFDGEAGWGERIDSLVLLASTIARVTWKASESSFRTER